MNNPKRIAVTGPESTGKSWLSEQLAFYHLTDWVPEYSREYLAGIKRPYEYDDILQIAKGQLAAENRVIPKAHRFLFCDTELIVTKIWCEVKYGKCHPWIEEQIQQHRYDLYLLCDIDLPWEQDPLREHPEMRKELFVMYDNELRKNNFPYRIVNGFGMARLDNAKSALDDFFV
jgi:NadR type nicotinamide-nucleotide adenylyltransferase